MIDTTNYEFLTAHFSNNERTVATVYWGNKDETIEEIVKAEDKSPAWQRLLDHMDIDTLHEMTYKHIRDQVETYENEVIRVAKDRGLIYDINDIDSKLHEIIVKILFKEYDPKKDKEKLFMLKLSLFELDFVKSCTNNDLKRNLRKAENFIEAIAITIDIKNSL